MCSLTKLCGNGVPTSIRYYYSLILHRYSCVLFFLPVLVFNYPMLLPQRWCPPSPLPPLRTTPPHYTPPPTSYRRSRSYPSTLTLPGSLYPASLLDGSLVSPPAYPYSITVFFPCLHHVARLSPLSLPSKTLIHAPMISPIFLHLRGNPSKKHSPMVQTICGTIYQSRFSFVNGMSCQTHYAN